MGAGRERARGHRRVKGRGLAHPFPTTFLQRGVCAERLANHEPMLYLGCAHRARTAKRHWHGPMTRPLAIHWRGAFGVGDWSASRSRNGCNPRAAVTRKMRVVPVGRSRKMRGTSHIAICVEGFREARNRKISVNFIFFFALPLALRTAVC